MNDSIHHSLERLLSLLFTGFVDHPDDLETRIQETSAGAFIQVKVNLADYGQVIGKKGRNISAVREVTAAYLQKQNIPLRGLTVTEPTIGFQSPYKPHFKDEDWTIQKARSLSIIFEDTIKLLDPSARVTFSDLVSTRTRFRIEYVDLGGPACVLSLNDIFRAIGKARGRELSLEFVDGVGAV